MKNTSFKLASAGVLALAMSGCSSILTDHANDYQYAVSNTTQLKEPPGSLQVRDDLVIPNVNEIPDLQKTGKFVTPRAPFIFYPMTKIPVSNKADRMVFDVPAGLDKTKEMVKGFLGALHGQGEAIATDKDNQIISVPFEFVKQGFWGSVASTFTRDFPEKTVFSFTFKRSGNDTIVSMQFKQQEQGKDVTSWQSPEKDPKRYTDAIRLWGNLGRQISEASAYLSQRGENSPFPIWVDHRGIFAVHLKTTVDLAAQVKAAGLHFVDGQSNKLAIDKQEAQSGAKLDEQTFPYKVETQRDGKFLVIDASKVTDPELASFQLVQRFIAK
ncbi:hypothetical protein MSP8887_02985 [Marinomonas spartinae]|uniref:hypothetical protein n=1 Tax=Marinomonas spartinae TaxID=1792290 RepID=UPI000808CC0D|nr:hypothetical protein [Marinomonas spartinae]SBS37602.1 hypothetical protein MSP8887_02985 [Marinomonas spartinae]